MGKIQRRFGLFSEIVVDDELHWSTGSSERFNKTKNRWERVYLISGEEFLVGAMPGQMINDNYIGVFDLTGLGLPAVIAERIYYAAAVGGGTYVALNEAGGGLTLTTGAAIGNNNILSSGDLLGPRFTFNVDRNINCHLDIRLPLAADLLQVQTFVGFYADANNYAGLRYNAAAAPAQLQFVTRALGVETVTNLGLMDNDWKDLWMKFSTDRCVAILDLGTPVIHTTNIPVADLAYYIYIETQENVAKSLDIGHLIKIQDVH